MKAHPVADLFPMMSNDELKDLAVDIAARGLLAPIVLYAEDIVFDDDVILDGRNRFEACGIAGVEPTFVAYEGDDPVGYALAANIHRRHMTKGQQALVVAKALLVSNNRQTETARAVGISQTRISQANTVIKYADEWVDSVMSGACSLDEAYELAKDRRDKAKEAERLLAQLHDCAPDLADQVVEGKLTVHEASKLSRDRQSKREQQDRQRKQVATDLMCEHVWIVANWRSGRAADIAQKFDPTLASAGRQVTLQTLLDAQTAINEIVDAFKERGLP